MRFLSDSNDRCVINPVAKALICIVVELQSQCGVTEKEQQHTQRDELLNNLVENTYFRFASGEPVVSLSYVPYLALSVIV